MHGSMPLDQEMSLLDLEKPVCIPLSEMPFLSSKILLPTTNRMLPLLVKAIPLLKVEDLARKMMMQVKACAYKSII